MVVALGIVAALGREEESFPGIGALADINRLQVRKGLEDGGLKRPVKAEQFLPDEEFWQLVEEEILGPVAGKIVLEGKARGKGHQVFAVHGLAIAE